MYFTNANTRSVFHAVLMMMQLKLIQAYPKNKRKAKNFITKFSESEANGSKP